MPALTATPDPPAPPADAPDDYALVRASLSGEMSAFAALYRRHAARVHGVVVRLVGHAGARAEDVTQDAFVRAWQALPGFRFESAFSTWLHRLAVTTALMELRRQRTRADHSSDDALLDALDTPDSAGHHTALAMDLHQAVASLPARARAVLVLHDVEGWKHEEIADTLDIAIGSCKAQLHRARRLLRARLGNCP